MPIKEELSKLYAQEVSKTKEKEQEMLRLIKVKAEKLTNNYLIEHEHTQLSYLPKEQQEERLSMPKGLLIDKIIAYLKSI